MRLGAQGVGRDHRTPQAPRRLTAQKVKRNFAIGTANKSDKDRVIIFDTTLRDGEQCPGATMTFEEKLEVAEMLDDRVVDVADAGFPTAPEGDFQGIGEIARRSKN